jgi:hypothetical protein
LPSQIGGFLVEIWPKEWAKVLKCVPSIQTTNFFAFPASIFGMPNSRAFVHGQPENVLKTATAKGTARIADHIWQLGNCAAGSLTHMHKCGRLIQLRVVVVLGIFGAFRLVPMLLFLEGK